MSLEVSCVENFKFQIECRGHQVISDQPRDHGGEDEGMAPVELFLGSLGVCIGVYIAHFCKRHHIETKNLKINLSWGKAEDPPRIGHIDIGILLPEGVDEKFEPSILRAANSCLIHCTLKNSPNINIRFQDVR